MILNHKIFKFPQIILAIIVFLLNIVEVKAQNNQIKKDWQADYDYLVHLVEKNHVNSFWKETPKNWKILKNEIQFYLKKSENIDRDRMVSYFTKMIAFIGDGHSSYLDIQHLNAFPLKLKYFKDGLYIIGTTEEDNLLLGKKIIEIGGKNITKALEIVKAVTPMANKSGFEKFSPFAIINANLMHGIGLANNNKEINLKVTGTGGTEIVKVIKSLPLEQYGKVNYNEVAFSTYSKNIGIYHSKENYTFEYLPMEKAVYFKFNSVRDNQNQSLKSFSDSLIAFCKTIHPTKLIIDVRENDGGNNFLSAYLVEKIASTEEINQPGKLFLITGYQTFSAAVSFAIQLQKRTNVIIAGVPPGDSPNFPADNETYILPNSKGIVKISSQFWVNSFAYDKRVELEPEIYYAATFFEAVKGIDKALDSIFLYKLPMRQLTSKGQKLDKYSGSYMWGIDKKITLFNVNNNYRIVSSDKFQTDLVPVSNRPNIYTTRIKGVDFEAKNGILSLVLNNEKVQLEKITNFKKIALEEIYQGNLDKAEELYKQLNIKGANKTFELKGNNLSMNAANLYYQTNNKERCSKLLIISSKLDPAYKEAGDLLNFITK